MAEETPPTGRRPDPYDVDVRAMMRAIPVRGLLIAAAAVSAALYLGDLALILVSRDRFDTVTVTRLYATALKGNKIDFQTADSADVRCVNSLFPHFGLAPCWYLRRHSDIRIDI